MESYCVSVKHSFDDEKLKEKFDQAEKDSTLAKVKEVEDWASSNPEAETE